MAGGDASLLHEAEDSLQRDPPRADRLLDVEAVAQGYALAGDISSSLRVVQEFSLNAEEALLARYSIFCLRADTLPVWPAECIEDGKALAEEAEGMYGFKLARRLAELHPQHAPTFLDIAMAKSQTGGRSLANGMRRQIVQTAAQASRANKQMLPYAREAVEQITDPASQLRARIDIIEAEAHWLPRRVLSKLKAKAERQLRTDDPIGLARFISAMRNTEHGAKVVSLRKEHAAIAAIPDVYERAEQLGRLAARTQDMHLLKVALDTSTHASDPQARLWTTTEMCRNFGPAGAVLAKPYVLDAVNGAADVRGRDMDISQLAQLLVRAGRPEEAYPLLDLIEEDKTQAAMAAAGVVRATAMQGRQAFGAAQRIAQETLHRSDERRKDFILAALVIGSARYRTPHEMRTDMQDVQAPFTRSEAWCEIALVQKDAQYLVDATTDAEELLQSGAAQSLINVIRTHAVLRGKPVKPQPGIGWYAGVHRWAFPTKDAYA